MSIKTAVLNGVATIEIARPEKKNALTAAMYQAMADALRRGGRRQRGARRADHRPARHLHLGQRHRGLHAAPAARRRLAGGAVHAGAGRLRQAGGRRGHRRGDRHRHDDAAALRLRLRERRSAAGDAVRQPRPGARVRLEPVVARADGPSRARPRSCCSATRSPPRSRWSAACQRRAAGGRGGQPRAPRRRALQRAAAGRGARDQAADAPRHARSHAADDRRSKASCSRKRLRSPEAKEAFQAFFQKRKPDFSKF